MKRPELLPRPVRQAGFAAVGLRNRIRRFGREYRNWRKLLVVSDDWEPASREAWQLHSLRTLLHTARTGTTHYRSLPGVRAALEKRSLHEALTQLPVLTKNELRAHPESFQNLNVPLSLETSTSGSTGAPMMVGHDGCSIQRRFAFLHDHLCRAESPPFAPSVRLSGRIFCRPGAVQRAPWLSNYAENQLFLSSYHLDAEHADCIRKKLLTFRPVRMDGYPSAILSTLRLIEAHTSELPLRTVVTTAETLHPDIRREIEQLSNAKVLDYYAASEGVPFIQQCVAGIYHVRWQSGIFEVDTGSGISFSGDGELICTSFVQARTPLIRYRTGDLVSGLQIPVKNACSCGLTGPIVERVLGRVEDLIYTADGRSLGMFTYRTLKLIKGLGDTQVIQHTPTHFQVRTTTPTARSGDSLEMEIKETFERTLGYPISLTVEFVERLPLGPNGKVRLVKSFVSPQSPAT